MRAHRTVTRSVLPVLFSVCLSFAQNIPPAPASLTVSGDIPSPLTLNLADIAAMPHQVATVADENGKKIAYEGVPLREILLKAGAPLGGQLRGKNLTTYVLAKAHDGYQVIFTLAEFDTQFANEPIWLVDKRDGGPLQEDQGPLRLACPNDKTGARSVRMLEALEIVRVRK